MVFTGAGEPSLFIENVCLAAALLMVLAVARVWIFYRFQMRAIESLAPLIRKARCRQLSGGGGSFPAFRISFRADLGMIFDLGKWRFRDFYPDLHEEEYR
ncbi:MAG: hypothetical protein M0017_01770 [Desulfobacteraceae bacterium]|nr:hypothetical protein [Desulfobacteraceae bacterium]